MVKMSCDTQASFVILGVTVHWHVMAVIILAVAGCVEIVVWSCERIKKSCEFETNLERGKFQTHYTSSCVTCDTTTTTTTTLTLTTTSHTVTALDNDENSKFLFYE